MDWRHRLRDGYVFCLKYVVRQTYISSLLGLASFVILRIYFGKTVEDFNGSIKAIGDGAPALVANTGNAFTSASLFRVIGGTFINDKL
jgi:hypothetical protein